MGPVLLGPDRTSYGGPEKEKKIFLEQKTPPPGGSWASLTRKKRKGEGGKGQNWGEGESKKKTKNSYQRPRREGERNMRYPSFQKGKRKDYAGQQQGNRFGRFGGLMRIECQKRERRKQPKRLSQ